MHGKFRLLSPGKESSHSTALPCFVVCFFLCAVFSCLLNPPNSDMDYRIFNTAYVIILMGAYTPRGWTHRQQIRATFLLGKTLTNCSCASSSSSSLSCGNPVDEEITPQWADVSQDPCFHKLLTLTLTLTLPNNHQQKQNQMKIIGTSVQLLTQVHHALRKRWGFIRFLFIELLLRNAGQRREVGSK